MNNYHYTYILTDDTTNEFYIGVRSSKCHPKDDIKYMGSMKTWKVDKLKLTKEIICLYDTRQAANDAEVFMLTIQLKYNKNKLCRNACISNRHFYIEGQKRTEAFKENLSKSRKGIPRDKDTVKKMSDSLKGNIPWNKGKKTKKLTEEHKNKISEGVKKCGRDWTQSEGTKEKIRQTLLNKNKHGSN